MARRRQSLIGKAVEGLRRPIPFNDQWNVQSNSLYGGGPQDRFTQIQATRSTGTLYAIIQLLSTGQAKSVWNLFRSKTDARYRYSRMDVGSDMRQQVLTHQALKLWRRPNPFWTGHDFREMGWQFMELVGEWYWILNRGPSGDSFPLELWTVRPDRMTPVPDKKNFLAGWVYTGPNGEQVPLSCNEVIQMKYPDPSDPYRGLSPVQALLADIDSSKYTAEWSRNFFLNSATPGGIVTFAKRLSDEEFNEFSARWREQHQGVARGHRVGVLEQGATWTQNTMTMNDMQFADLQRISRDKIREAYRIHQAMLGNSDDVNRANAQTAEEVHVAWHEIPRLERTRTVANEFFIPMFYPEDDQDVEFDFNDPTPSSATESNEELIAKAQAASLLVSGGWQADDVLNVVGLPPMRWSTPVITGGGKPGQNGRGQSTNTRDFNPDTATHGQTDDQVAARFALEAIRNMRRGSISDGEALALGRMMLSQMDGTGNGNGHSKELIIT